MNNSSNKYRIQIILTAFVAMAMNCHAQSTANNGFWNNWEVGFGIEGLSFYSGREKGTDISNSPFDSRRANFGAAATAIKWFSPEIGLRTKASGYWGKAVSYLRPKDNNVTFFSLQEAAVLDVKNIIKGYEPNRKWRVAPYLGAGIIRNVTHNETSLGASVGMLTDYSVNNQMRIHLDLGATFAGSEMGNYNGNSMMGHYRWFSAEIGVTFNLGKSRWGSINRQGKFMTPSCDYSELDAKAKMTAKTEYISAKNDVPTGMTVIPRGHVRMGEMPIDSLWGFNAPIKDVSVDDFWMDLTEVTNAMYREFVKEVINATIARKQTEMEVWDSIFPVKPLWKTNPVTGEKNIDVSQLLYKYETYDWRKALGNNDDVIVKDTAYFDAHGNVVNKKISRKATGPWDYINTYIVNVYPDTLCWIKDFPDADNAIYAKYYFSHPTYNDYPVVGVTWQQANAYCAWKTAKERALALDDKEFMEYRLPTEAEWEYAAKGQEGNLFPWENKKGGQYKSSFYANFMPAEGDFTEDGNIITSRVGTYAPNTNGLYDMAGNAAEWTATDYYVSGVKILNNINPNSLDNSCELACVKGGSWKDSESHILPGWRMAEYKNIGRSYIGFRCVRSIVAKNSGRKVIVISAKSNRK